MTCNIIFSVDKNPPWKTRGGGGIILISMYSCGGTHFPEGNTFSYVLHERVGVPLTACEGIDQFGFKNMASTIPGGLPRTWQKNKR